MFIKCTQKVEKVVIKDVTQTWQKVVSRRSTNPYVKIGFKKL